MSDPVERRVGLFGWLEKQLTLPVVGSLLVLVFAAGEIRFRFELMETEIEILVAREELLATKRELATVEDRLRKWIGRMEAAQDRIAEMEKDLAKMETSNARE